MAAKHNFRKLTIWKEGIELTKETYSTTNTFPKSEAYSLTSQLQRAAVSNESFKHLEIKIQSIQGMITRFMENLEKNIS